MREGVTLNLERLSSNARAEFYARRLKISTAEAKIVMIVISDPVDHPNNVALFFLFEPFDIMTFYIVVISP